MPRLAMTLAGFLFLLIAVVHIGHIFYDVEFKIAGYVVPLWINVAGSIFFLLLALLMFWSVQMFSRRGE
jgi:hypothetical protein